MLKTLRNRGKMVAFITVFALLNSLFVGLFGGMITTNAAVLNIAKGKQAYASGCELDQARFYPINVTDGSDTTRWSSNPGLPGSPVWIYVDLGSSNPIREIVIKWEAANAKTYAIEISNDAQNWQALRTYNHASLAQNAYTERYQLETEKTARYVRVYITGGNGYPHASIFEIEVYSQTGSVDVLQTLKNTPPTISSDGKKVVLPTSPDSDYTIALYGTSHSQIVDINGNIYTPLVDTNVQLMYQAINKSDPTIVQKGDFTVSLNIKGRYTTQTSDNKKPDVLPALREWKGDTGSFTAGTNTRIVVDNANNSVVDALYNKALIIRDYLIDMVRITPDVVKSSSAAKGDIFLTMSGSSAELGDEGYYLEIGDTMVIKAAHETGILYGGISVTQILSTNKNTLEVARGTARDYPAYSIRSGMIDVARAWLPFEYVQEITRYFAYYKLNEIHLHINDQGENGYSAFRLESNVQGLTSTDGFYTKDAYRQYQKDVKKLGISVITEIDTPAHSKAFSKITPPVPMIDDYHLDITKPATLEFVKNLFDEYMTGDDPVFVNKKVHIGTDEYPGGYNEQMRAYTDALIKYANSRGYKPRIWGSFGKQGFNGTTPVSGNGEANYWATELSDYKTLYEYGYDIINTCGPLLYIVPGGNYGFADYLNLSSLYNSWQVNYFTYGGTSSMPLGHPQTKGAGFALWNDLYTAYGGFSQFDIFDRLKGAVALMAEKTWCGEQTKDISSNDFMRRVELLSDKAALTNPGRFYAGDNNGIVDITQVKKSVGFPYTVSFDVQLPDAPTGEVLLFDGEDGQFIYNLDNKGLFGFKRGVYTFTYGYKAEPGKKLRITLTADNKQTILIVDDTFFFKPTNQRAGVTRKDSSTFVFPVEKISDLVSNITIKSLSIDLNVRKANNNHALNKKVTVSGLEVSDGRFTANLAVDGDEGTRVSFARGDKQWMIVDLGSLQQINKVDIMFHEHVPEYKVYVSKTGEDNDWTEVYHLTGGAQGTKQTDSISFSMTEARYVKYEQLKMHYVEAYKAYYSGGIFEFRVSGYDKEKYESAIVTAEKLAETNPHNNDASSLKASIAELKEYLKQVDIYSSHADGLLAIMLAESESFNTPGDSSEIDNTSDTPPVMGDPTSPYIFAAFAACVLLLLYYVCIKRRRRKA